MNASRRRRSYRSIGATLVVPVLTALACSSTTEPDEQGEPPGLAGQWSRINIMRVSDDEFAFEDLVRQANTGGHSP